MRCVTYAGETVTTTDDVAEALVTLTAAVASYDDASAVRIPILLEDGSTGEAQLVIGVGTDVLSAPTAWDGDDPDFSVGAQELRDHPMYPAPPATAGIDQESPILPAIDEDDGGSIDYI